MINTADLCFAMATALSANRVDALDYTRRGLKLAPRHPGLLRLSKLLRDTPEVFADSANQAQQYEAMIPKVLNEIRSPNLDGNDERLLNAEASLNRFWMSVLPPRSDPEWEETVEVLCAQGRFKARGSEAYLRWCRVQGMNNQGVDYFVERVRNVELTELQSRSDWHCSDYLAQGFSCMLDTQDPEHIQQALDIIDALEPVLTWKETPSSTHSRASRRGPASSSEPSGMRSSPSSWDTMSSPCSVTPTSRTSWTTHRRSRC